MPYDPFIFVSFSSLKDPGWKRVYSCGRRQEMGQIMHCSENFSQGVTHVISAHISLVRNAVWDKTGEGYRKSEMMHEYLGPEQKPVKRHASKSPTCWYFEGLSGLLFVGLEGVHKLEELQELEFGRGFIYNQPLSITLKSLPSILLKQLVSIFFLFNTILH